MIILVFGVTGCGKSTVGELLARKLKLPFHDGDQFHPDANVQKMALGIPLTDEDRMPWLKNLAGHIQEWDQNKGAVLACSALNEKYRNILQAVPSIHWVLLEGSKDLIRERLELRVGHFMNPDLLDSQFDTLEKPSYGLAISIHQTPESIINEILSNLMPVENQSEFGIIGMGVMGKSLALNLADKGIPLSIYNRHVAGLEERVAKLIVEESSHLTNIQGFDYLVDFVDSLSLPRKILLMIPAGEAVDLQIQELMPLLQKGDVLIDGGNSFFKDTSRRALALEEKGVHFVGAGVSGGEEGALKGPSIMPGGSEEGFRKVTAYFEMIAAKDKSGVPCTAYIGPGGAGHFIKMVHNSIEYAEMQVLAEVYYLLREYMQCGPTEISDIFTKWQREGLDSYLLTITIDILQTVEGNGLLLDKILDQAAQKGTGGWSVNTALAYGVPYGVLTEAVMARLLSAHKEERVEASKAYGRQVFTGIEDKKRLVGKLKNAYEASRIINHDVGFNLMREVSQRHGWNLDFSEIARIWTNGCIIRSQLMENLVTSFKSNNRILIDPLMLEKLKKHQDDLSYIVGQGLQNGFALPVFSAAINYFLGSVTANSPANMIQAQRDYFGAHTYQRIDKPKDQYFHTDWKEAIKLI
ncbi:MAG: NADP-dependent phosphogluconate dehydrogenase [Anditalea sp.]